ncbi:MAG: hypothetical protein RJB15_919 [Pseudomonadota bacterium]|jgi:predicted membrane channel-forming protein YqfA (hemolysin III family)
MLNLNDSASRIIKEALIYFQGEKIEALVFILPIGLISLVFCAWLLTDDGSAYAKGLAIPFLVMGLLMTTVGAVVGYRTPGQISQLEKALKSSPETADAALINEQQRMIKVNRAWNHYLVIWALMGVLGLLLRFVARGEFMQGLGIGLVFFCGVGLIVDGFAERRTHPYSEVLNIRKL